MGKNFWGRIVAALIFVSLGLAGLWFIIFITGLGPEQKPIEIPIGTITPPKLNPSQYPDYDVLRDLNAVVLAKDKESSASNKNDEDLTKILEVKGDFSRIYFYAESSVNNKPLTDWDSLYVKFNTIPPKLDDLKSGGHLYRPQSLKVPMGNNVTRLLFNISVVPYIPTIPYSEARSPTTVNWFEDVFRQPSNPSEVRKIRFDTFLSTTENGKIYLIALYYKCFQETPDCYIKIIEG